MSQGLKQEPLTNVTNGLEAHHPPDVSSDICQMLHFFLHIVDVVSGHGSPRGSNLHIAATGV